MYFCEKMSSDDIRVKSTLTWSTVFRETEGERKDVGMDRVEACLRHVGSIDVQKKGEIMRRNKCDQNGTRNTFSP